MYDQYNERINGYQQFVKEIQASGISEENWQKDFMKMLETWDNALKMMGQMITEAKSTDGSVGLSGK